MTTISRCVTFSVLFYFSYTLAAQTGNTTANKIIDTIHSGILKEDRFAWVHLPSSTVGKSSSKTTYPVVYVLDAEANFETILEILNQLSKKTSNSIFSQTIVVGVGNIWERDRDYTPTHISSSPFVEKMAAEKSGGGEKFTVFLEKELIPYINSKYPVSSSRLLIGHSLGGLTAMNILLNHTKLFSGYAAIDPSMWWDDQKLLKQSKTI
jgi:predicted alpha/beta superfamily hydrolase